MTVKELPDEIFSIFTRWVRKIVRRPTFLFFSLVQPLVWFLLLPKLSRPSRTYRGSNKLQEHLHI